RGIELPAAQPVDGGAREGVVVVVPGLAEGGEGEPEDVGRLVLDLEPAGSEEVTDRVDAPGDVVDEEDANQPAPEQAGGGAQQGAGEQVAGQRRDRQTQEDQADEAPVEDAHATVLVEVGGVALPVGAP